MPVASNQGSVNGEVDVKDECVFFKRKLCHIAPAYEMSSLEITKYVKQQSEAKRNQLCLPLYYRVVPRLTNSILLHTLTVMREKLCVLLCFNSACRRIF